MKTIKDLDIVALTEDIEATHFETKEIIKLSKGQVGTVVMEFDGSWKKISGYMFVKL
jgi:hypothetical protein